MYGSGSHYHQAKIVRKTLISTVFWLFFDFLSLKNDVMYLQKIISRKTFFKNWFFVAVLKVSDDYSRIWIRLYKSEAWIRGSGSEPKYQWIRNSATCPFLLTLRKKWHSHAGGQQIHVMSRWWGANHGPTWFKVIILQLLAKSIMVSEIL